MMTKPRLDGIYLLLIGTLLFLILGIALEQNSPHAMQDFRVLYNPARCLLQHCDPYNEREVLRLYREEGGDQQSETPVVRVIVTRYIYPPTAFLCTVPFASVPWRTAHILWMTFTLGGIIVASFFAWDLGATYAPILSSVMVGFLLINSVSIVISGNSAGLAVSLCVVAVWCFMRERIRVIGILCLAISLAIKPHDTGLVWLLFFFAGGVYRKRALQALAVLAALSLPLVIWVSEVSPRWVQEMQSNLSSFSVHGGLNDPSPSAAVANGPGMLTNLQALFSVYRDDPHFYNLATYAVCAPLLLLWAFMVLRTRTSQAKVWLALAAIVTLTLLPIYHREYDAKLLLLTVPACAMLWAEGGFNSWLAVLVNGTAIFINGDLPQAMLLGWINRLHGTGRSDQGLAAMQAFPAPMVLLVMAVFYLWVCVGPWMRNRDTPVDPPNPR